MDISIRRLADADAEAVAAMIGRTVHISNARDREGLFRLEKRRVPDR